MLNNLLVNAASLSQEDADRLRTRVKYLIFDLEATRREREYWKLLCQDTPDPSDISDMF